MLKLKGIFLIALVALTITACNDDDDLTTTQDLVLNFSGLEDLGSDYAYEGWIIVDGTPVSSGVFTVDANGAMSQNTFAVNTSELEKATAYVLTIEPSPDPSPNASPVHILAGDFSGSSATLTVDHSAALGSDFTSATGKYILATPTDGMDNNENSGVWWLDPAAGPGPGLSLPTLPDGWNYEGWAVINGTPVSTGIFTSASGADAFGGYSGTMGGPPFPGEDFVANAPGSLTFPTDLSEATVVISIEPSPDNSANPFALKPLVGNVPAGAADHTVYDMSNNAAATNPTGTASR